MFHSADVIRSASELKACGSRKLAQRVTVQDGEIHYNSKLRINLLTQSTLISVQQAPLLKALDYSPCLRMITLNNAYKRTHNGEVMSTSRPENSYEFLEIWYLEVKSYSCTSLDRP